MMTASAFSMDSRVTMSRGFRSSSTALSSTRADSAAESIFSWCTLAMVDEYGRLMPMASNEELMVLAVYMPQQAPLQGMACGSMLRRSASDMRPAASSPTASQTLTMLRSWQK